MKNSSETIEKVLALCGGMKCSYIIYEVEDWNADFSPWAFYESQAFSVVINCSGSLWFGDWISYTESHTAPQNSSVYLSHGKREEKDRDRVMATVRDCENCDMNCVFYYCWLHLIRLLS